ncbi:MAG: hypothetical protein IJ745_00715 [Bacteroidales bacterium]|nr:hypothetical protein [Bacteroidales bacterium]
MKQFVKPTAVVVLLALVLIMGGEMAVRLIPDNDVYTFKYNYLEKHPDAVKTLLMGHSQIAYGVNPSLIGDSVFNMAISGRVIYFDMELLRHFLPKMHNLQSVVLPMHYTFSGFNDFYEFKASFNTCCFHYFKDMHIRHPDYNGFYRKSYFSYRFLKSNEPCVEDEKGFKKITRVYTKRGTSTDKTQRQSRKDEFRTLLCEVARLCHSYGVRLIVVSTPCANDYVAQTRPEGMETLQGVADSIRRLYPIEYHNYINDESFRNDSLYSDESHLNHIGAEQFSLRLKADFGL